MTNLVAHRLSEFLIRYGISNSKAWKEINAGRLKARKNGRYVIITEEDAQAWLNSLPVIEPKVAA